MDEVIGLRILNDEAEEALNKISLFHTDEEALDLYRSLDSHYRDEDGENQLHTHVDSYDGRQKSLFFATYQPDDPNLEPHWRAFFKDDIWIPPPKS